MVFEGISLRSIFNSSSEPDIICQSPFCFSDVEPSVRGIGVEVGSWWRCFSSLSSPGFRSTSSTCLKTLSWRWGCLRCQRLASDQISKVHCWRWYAFAYFSCHLVTSNLKHNSTLTNKSETYPIPKSVCVYVIWSQRLRWHPHVATHSSTHGSTKTSG